MPDPAFIALAVIAVASAILALEAKEVVYGAMGLALSLLAVAGLFILLEAPFVAMFQVTVYVGAVVVLILFTIMLVRREAWLQEPGGPLKVLSVLGALLVAGGLLTIAVQSELVGWLPPEEFGLGLTDIGGDMLLRFSPALVMMAIVLSVALLGALTLAKVERERGS